MQLIELPFLPPGQDLEDPSVVLALLDSSSNGLYRYERVLPEEAVVRQGDQMRENRARPLQSSTGQSLATHVSRVTGARRREACLPWSGPRTAWLGGLGLLYAKLSGPAPCSRKAWVVARALLKLAR